MVNFIENTVKIVSVWLSEKIKKCGIDGSAKVILL